MFLQKEELNSKSYAYILEQITEGDDSIIDEGINAAIEEVKSYLTPNNKQAWLDGRKIYDAEAIFNATGNDRNALILSFTKNIAVWKIIELCNADMIYEKQRELYDRAINYLDKLSKGHVTISLLPSIEPTSSIGTKQPFRYGSRTKFNHY
jgi:hypothetical protein